MSIALLDCTLRDGGYVNDWKWGFLRAKDIVRCLTASGIDVVEVGFLRDVVGYDENITVCSRIEELNLLLPEKRSKTRYSAMAMQSNYDLGKLSPYSGKGIDLIRVTAHDYDIAEGLKFAEKVKSLGYKVSMNPINIMGYTVSEVVSIIKRVNEINPYQFSVVDTYGSMKQRDFERLVRIADSELNPDVRLGLHLHNNLALPVALSQRFLDIKFNRGVTIDASLFGIGRDPGNLQLELIADHINDLYGGSYRIEHLLDAIEDHVMRLYGNSQWGYKPAYFLSARHNLHRNYSEYYIGKGDLTHRDIDAIFRTFDKGKKSAFNQDYADHVYQEYKLSNIDDTQDREKLKAEIGSRPVLVMAPGNTLSTHKDVVTEFIASHKPVIIAVNFAPRDYEADFAFFGNARRYQMFSDIACKRIVTSNVTAKDDAEYHLNYVLLVERNDRYINSLPLLLRLLSQIGIAKVSLAGADGFDQTKQNYFDEYLLSAIKRDDSINDYTSGIIKSIGLKLNFVTPSLYETER
ncbi:MAG: aldolase catalytic domain-containing protein [Clostridiales bacterium]|jgi:4-hydroxy 2-oxovalerate aldolase|nr:aldolase catalytic domain-containing protein [Clostridiales bacterium]